MNKSLSLLARIFLSLLLVISLMPAAWAAHGGPAGFADLAEKLLPAVVNISTSQTITASAEDLPDLPPDLQFPPGSPFEQFFHDFKEKEKNTHKKHKATAL